MIVVTREFSFEVVEKYNFGFSRNQKITPPSWPQNNPGLQILQKKFSKKSFQNFQKNPTKFLPVMDQTTIWIIFQKHFPFLHHENLLGPVCGHSFTAPVNRTHDPWNSETEEHVNRVGTGDVCYGAGGFFREKMG